jgi:hypothetical protein
VGDRSPDTTGYDAGCWVREPFAAAAEAARVAMRDRLACSADAVCRSSPCACADMAAWASIRTFLEALTRRGSDVYGFGSQAEQVIEDMEAELERR